MAGRRGDRWGHLLGCATVGGAFAVGVVLFVDMPAALPDGSPARESVSSTLRQRRIPPRPPRPAVRRHLRAVTFSAGHGFAEIEYSTNGHHPDGKQ